MAAVRLGAGKMKITLVLERDVFKDHHDRLANALKEMAIHAIDWNDD